MHSAHTLLYYGMVVLFYSLFAAIFFGVSVASAHNYSTYMNALKYYILVYTSLYLLYRFNPITGRAACTPFDREIAFSAGLVILTSFVIDVTRVDKMFDLN